MLKGSFYLLMNNPNQDDYMVRGIKHVLRWWVLSRFDGMTIRGWAKQDCYNFTLLSGIDCAVVASLVHRVPPTVMWFKKTFDNSFIIQEVKVEDLPLYMGDLQSVEFERIMKDL